jgi:hypothetical protein
MSAEAGLESMVPDRTGSEQVQDSQAIDPFSSHVKLPTTLANDFVPSRSTSKTVGG